MTAPTGGHVLRVRVEPGKLVFGVDCHEPADADCATVDGGCLVAEQAETGPMFEEFYGGAGPLLLHDGMPIAVMWEDGEDGCYRWSGVSTKDGEAPTGTAEKFLIRTTGGPHPGTRVVNAEGVRQYEWPLPEMLPAAGGHYRKVQESNLGPQEPGANGRQLVLRGADYEWRPASAKDGATT